MKWWLDHETFITCRHRLISYCEIRHDHVAKVTLNEHQFNNLDDVIHSMEKLSYVIPLGGSCWLIGGRILHSDGQWDEFKFRERFWDKYIRHIHSQIVSFLHHERTCHQRLPRNGSQQRARFRAPSSTSDWQQISSWPTANVSGNHEERTESPTLPSRQDSNPGQHFSFRRSLHVLRHPSTDNDLLPDPELDAADFEKFGSVCSIEEPCCAA